MDSRHSLMAYLVIFGPLVLGLEKIEDRWPSMFLPSFVVFAIMGVIACFVYHRFDLDGRITPDSEPKRRVVVRPFRQSHAVRRTRRRIREHGRPSVRIAQGAAWVTGVGGLCLSAAFEQLGWFTYSGEILLVTFVVFPAVCVWLWWLTYGPGSWESNRDAARGETLLRMDGDKVRSIGSASRRSDGQG